MHTIPARLSPPPRATANPHALQKGHARHTCLLELEPCTLSTYHHLTSCIQQLMYAGVLVHTITSTAINNYLFAPQKKKQVCI